MNIPTNLKLIESGTIPTTTTLTKGQVAFGKVPSSGELRLFVNINNSVDELNVMAFSENITYSQLVAKVNAGKLNTGKKYVISDYQTIYKQPVTDLLVVNSVIEPLVVTALTPNTLSEIAFSTINPKDIIHYTINNDDTLYTWTTSQCKGVIYRRIDQYGNDLPYDFRGIRFRRWAIDYANIPVWNNAGVSYSVGDVIKFNNDNKLYVCVFAHTSDPTTAPTITKTRWFQFFRDCAGTGKIYYSTTNTGIAFNVLNANSTIPVDANDYIDYYTFYDLTNSTDHSVSSRVKNNFISPSVITSTNGSKYKLTNSVFIGTDTSIYDNNIINHGLFENNTVIRHFQNNIINGIFSDNYTDGSFSGNSVLSFRNNILTNSFAYNEISNNFSYNLIGEGFQNNKIGDYYAQNVHSGTFFRNTVSYDCVVNHFIGSCTNNVIGNRCASNKISSSFDDNNIGNFFRDNTISTNFQQNIIGNYFSSNTADYGFMENVIGNNMVLNTISTYFQGNSIGNYFENNTIPNTRFQANNVGINVINTNFSSTEFYYKNYEHKILRAAGTNTVIATWYDSSGNLQKMTC
jgi:hypothetical protein